MKRLSPLVAALTALALAVPGAAGAKTFGSDLSVAPNVEFDCTVTPPVGGLQLPSGEETCTWWTTGKIDDTSQGHVVPYGGGTITRARVRVGPVTGPMQFVVLRSLRHPENLGDPGCCFPVGASEVFVPEPNGVTTVPMNVKARHDYDEASGLNNYDNIAISVLAPGVPIPAFFTGDQSLSAPTGGGFYPHYVPGTERTTGLFGVVGFQTLINADIDQSEPGTGTPTGPGQLTGPALRFPRRAPVRRGRAFLPLLCTSAQECAGILNLQRRSLRPAARRAGASAKRRVRGKRARNVVFGRARFSLEAGKRKRVTVRLTRAGRRLMRKRRRARVFVNVRYRGRQGIASRRIVLHRR